MTIQSRKVWKYNIHLEKNFPLHSFKKSGLLSSCQTTWVSILIVNGYPISLKFYYTLQYWFENSFHLLNHKHKLNYIKAVIMPRFKTKKTSDASWYWLLSRYIKTSIKQALVFNYCHRNQTEIPCIFRKALFCAPLIFFHCEDHS